MPMPTIVEFDFYHAQGKPQAVINFTTECPGPDSLEQMKRQGRELARYLFKYVPGGISDEFFKEWERLSQGPFDG